MIDFSIFEYISFFSCIVSFILIFLVNLWTKSVIISNKYDEITFNTALQANPRLIIGFFHPYCDARGGGERVLWLTIKALSELNNNVSFVIYSRNDVTDTVKFDILKTGADTFGLPFLLTDEILNRIKFVKLRTVRLLEAKTYPRFTLLGQSIGSMIVATEAFLKESIDVYFDTTGFAFTYPMVYFLGLMFKSRHSLRCFRIGCYTHYPTISTDMLNTVEQGVTTFNNAEIYRKNKLMRKMKLIYYRCFAALYSYCGRYSYLVVTNSSWTKGHIDALWKVNSKLVYPPCNIAKANKMLQRKRENIIISLGQFRPEKNHELQLEAFSIVVNKAKDVSIPKLMIIGGCRGEKDYQLVEKLKKKAIKLGIGNQTEFHVNVKFKQLKKYLSKGLIGIHTMKNEHFGIAPVEMQSYGLILVAHDSGGPKMDIVHTKDLVNGFLATTKEEYANMILKIITWNDDPILVENIRSIQENAFQSVQKFSDTAFVENMKKIMK